MAMDSNNKDSDSLEGNSGSTIETDSLEHGAADSGSSQPVKGSPAQPPAKHQPNLFKRISKRVNIYLLLFILVLVISGAVLVVTLYSGRSAQEPKIASQSIPTDTLKQLATADATVGDPKQVLNVQSNAVFAGKVLVQGSLDVAGQIHVNGTLSLPGITVSGDSTFDQLQVNKSLTIGGDASVLGQLNVKKSLAVSGGGTFGGAVTTPQLATNQLQLLGDLVLSSHLVGSGATPGRSGGGALGGGGTASVSGSDTAGSVNINTGSGPAANSCFLTVNFTSSFSNTPHVVVTPTSSAASVVSYYVTKSNSGFSICTSSAPPANSSLTFDYIVIG